MQTTFIFRSERGRKRLKKYSKFPVNQKINYKSLYWAFGFENAMLEIFV
jgi:hypothetical protein